MYYYLVALLKSNAPLLVYRSEEECPLFAIVSVSLKSAEKLGVVIQAVEKPKFRCKSCQKSESFFLEHQISLARFMAQYYCASYGEAFGTLIPKIQRENEGETTGLLQVKNHELSFKQASALEFCLNHRVSLLFGDTGSGKSEIYFHLIEKALKENKTSLFLMPEISLTPQMGRRLKNAFGSLVAIWHSRVTKKQKEKILQGLRDGEIKIIAGARSALFLPLENLGQIIIDEEHDDAYKSQSKPYYNTRDLALFLSKNFDIPVVLGSATPSVVSYFNAKDKGYLYRLKGKHFAGENSIILDSSNDVPSPKLTALIDQTLKQGKQVIVFIPTRGNFRTLICKSCAESIRCIHCDIALSLHSRENKMLCHYCGFSMPIPSNCPHCNSAEFLSHRMGTVELKSELEKWFKESRIGIFDRDFVGTDSKLKKITRDFKNGEIDILIGTQMIAKGHDYPNVELSVILGVDYLLNIPDFKCYERAFSLLYQVAGRAGRKSGGKVLIQSKNTGLISRYIQDYEEFLHFELKNRKNLYPPFRKLAILQFRDREARIAEEKMHRILRHLSERRNGAFEIVGAQKNTISKIAGIYRYHIFLRLNHQIKTIKILHNLLERYGDFDVDIDPIDMM